MNSKSGFKIERFFGGKRYIIELTNEEFERAFRLRDKEYRKEDAKRHLLDHFDIDVDICDEEEMAKAQEKINENGGNFNLEDIANDDSILSDLADDFAECQDCNIAENVTWQDVVKNFLRETFDFCF